MALYYHLNKESVHLLFRLTMLRKYKSTFAYIIMCTGMWIFVQGLVHHRTHIWWVSSLVCHVRCLWHRISIFPIIGCRQVEQTAWNKFMFCS